jgi:hypothetical protein
MSVTEESLVMRIFSNSSSWDAKSWRSNLAKSTMFLAAVA